MTTPATQPWRRATAALLSFLLALGPVGTPAYAAITDLADEPIAFVPRAAPNIVMTVDDSTSMLADFLPDYVIGAVPNTAVPGFCRDTTGAMNHTCGYIGDPKSPQHIWTDTGVPYPAYADGNPPNVFNYTASGRPNSSVAWPAPVHSNALNRAYYDPAVTYRPPVDAAGTPYANQTAFGAVRTDPWSSEVKTVDITAKVNVGMWCNSDWPLDTNPNPATGGGNHCRVNGPNYNQAFQVDKVPGDYQYPWQKVSGADNVKYFWRSGPQKTLWCDRASPKYPQSCTTTGYKCNTGTYIPPTAVPQSCVFQSNRMGCNPSKASDYTPAGCNTDPGAGPPGPCTKGAECTPCACNNTSVIGKNAQCKATVAGQPSSNANCGCNNSPIGTPCSLGACAPFTPPGAGTCSDGSPVVPVTTCTPASATCGTSLVDPVTKVATGVSLYQDSQTNGEVCRHNNWAYPDGTVANPFNYSAAHAKYKSQVTGTAAQGCGQVPQLAPEPRHYWKTSVEWCATRIATNVNDKWRGFGQAGSCQDDRDAAHPYPRYYKYGVPKTDPAYADNYTYPAFERVDLIAANAPFVHTFQRGATTVTITRTLIEEMTNYANWFAYYRTRVLAAKTVISHSFAFLDDQFRVGFHTLSNFPAASWVNVNPFDPAQKAAWYSQLFAVTIPMGNDTPNMEAVVRVGELFKSGSSASLAGATDPIVLSCQRNFHMLFTDGIQNQLALPAVSANNRDNTISIPYDLPLATPPLANGAAWPNLYREDTASPIANTIADYAMYYWATDLRGLTDNVITGKNDPAPWQHLNFAALSLGTEGTLNAKSVSATESLIGGGTLKWPKPAPNTWQPNATGVDDLWHAAVNGRGRFVNAKTSGELGRGIVAILRDLAAPKGSDAGAAFGNPNLSPTNRHVYIASFDGSTGNVKKVEIDPTTAKPATLPTTNWDAATAMTTQLTPTILMPLPWDTNRRVVTMSRDITTMNPGVRVPFRPGSLHSTQLGTLGPDLTTQTQVLQFLRGDRTLEGPADGQLRERGTGVLGDIVNASPVAVGPPDWPYRDGVDPGYSGFKGTFAARPKRVYAAANDGMLHALDDANGSEAWAFMPSDLYRGAPNDKEGLVGLSYQDGGLPFYEHRYYVNATPRVVDVDFSNGAGTQWRTLLVGGLGKGGKSYYAIDVTDPATIVDEATAASRVLWEFRHTDLGYTFGSAQIVKTRAHGWVVIVPSGYNNASGEGKIFVLRASNGALLHTIGTGSGTAASPSGLAHISGYVKDFRDQTVEQIYGGDLDGNVWRFDLSDPNPALWPLLAEKLATLTDGVNPQPITTPPQIEVDLQNGVDRWVFVGTGKLLHVNDLPSVQQQTMYAIRDGSHDTPGVIGPALTRADLSLVSNATGLGAGVIAAKGWYDDLPANTRMISAPEAIGGIVGYVATGLAVDPCEAGQPAHVFVRAFGNGQSVLADPGNLNNIVESIYVPEGGAALNVVALHDASCSGDCIPDLRIVVSTKSNSTIIPLRINLPGLLAQHRLSWRHLGP